MPKVIHITTQDRPTCRCCGKRLSKGTQWRSPAQGHFCHAKADLDAYVTPSEVIISMRWNNEWYNSQGKWVCPSTLKLVITSFSVWDGVSYGKAIYDRDANLLPPRFPGVCSSYCLQKLAVKMAEAYPDFRLAP